jgi:hypothetical protein
MEYKFENKAKYFAQHLGQRVLFNRSRQTGGHRVFFPIAHNSVLQLKSLSSISDDEVTEVARIVGWTHHDFQQLKTSGLNFINGGDEVCPLEDFCTCVDFLRSNGYALPYNGLSVQQLIDYGWLELV